MTEYGRGYATCLYQFVMHEPSLENERMLGFYRDTMGYPQAKAESSHVELWANGASDHFYDFLTGSRLPVRVRQRARRLASIALRCGHGFTDWSWTLEEARFWISEAKDLLAEAGDPRTLEEAMEIDRSLGINPSLGISCPEPMRESRRGRS